MAMKNQSDSLLIRSYIAGDEKALECIIERHQRKIYSFIYSKVNDRDITDDIFQDTFIKVIKTLKSNSYNEEGKFISWVMRIAHNLVIDYYRNNNKMPMQRDTDESSVFSTITDKSQNIESLLIKETIESDVLKILEELPEDQKEILKMRIFDDLSFKEISEIKKISINTALGRMRYAVLNMRKIIEKNQIILTN